VNVPDTGPKAPTKTLNFNITETQTMEASRGTSAAGERQPRVEDEEPSEVSTPAATIAGKVAEDADNISYVEPVPARPRPRSWNRSRSLSSSRWAGRYQYRPEVEFSDEPSYMVREPGPTHIRNFTVESYREDSPRRSRDYSPGSASEGGLPPSSECDLYDLDFDEDESRSPEEPLPQEWTQPRTVLEDGTATELIVAQSIERRVSKSGSEKIVLVSSSRPPPSAGLTLEEQEKSRAHFRWL